jgi:glycosyltransferase involved in cell wall biosynthesis
VIWIDLGNLAGFAEKISDLLKNKDRRGEMSEKASRFVKMYDWKKISKSEFE